MPDFLRLDDVAAAYERLTGHTLRDLDLVRHLRRPAVRHRLPPHRGPLGALRRGGTPRIRRRPDHEPRPPRAHARRHVLELTVHPVPLDEFPIHQTPLSLRYVGTSDRNFYDRAYFNAHDRTGDVFFVAGPRRVPQPGRHRRLRHRAARRPAVDDPLLRRPRPRPPLPRRRPVPGRGGRAPAAHPHGVRHRRPRPRLRPHVGGLVPRGDGAAPRHAGRGRRRPGDPRRLALRPGRDVVGHAQRRRRRHRRRPRRRGSGPATGPGGSGPWARASPPAARPTTPPPACGGSTSRCGSTTSRSSSSCRSSPTATAR